MGAKAKAAVVRMVPIRKVVVPENRKRSVKRLAELTASIGALGLINPITVTKDLVLVAGLHRLRACESLGWKEIPVIVLSLDQLDAELAEIDENLCRSELTALERSKQTARRKAIYEAKHPETRKGVAGGKARQKSAGATVAFAENTAQHTGRSRRSVEQDAQIGDGIAPKVQEAIRDTPLADRKRELIELAKVEDPKQQAQVAELVVTGQAKTIAAAREQLSAADSDATVVRDELDQVVSDAGIAEAFTILRPALLTVANHLRAGRRAWGAFHEEQEGAKRARIVAARGYFYVRTKVERDLKQLAYDIAASAPFAICPYCKGAPFQMDQAKRCEGCGGGGWVDKGIYDAAPPEMKAKSVKGVSRGR